MTFNLLKTLLLMPRFSSSSRQIAMVALSREDEGLGDTDGKRRDLVSCASVRVRLGEREKGINDPVAIAQISVLACFLTLEKEV